MFTKGNKLIKSNLFTHNINSLTRIETPVHNHENNAYRDDILK